MSTGAIVGVIIAAVVVLALVAFLARLELRRRRLRQRFGSEYDLVRQDAPKRRAAEQELTARERRHAELGIRPISPMSRDRHAKHWELIQATFVDQPTRAVDEADRLVVTIMEERGYPRVPFEERVSLLSVEHGSVLDHYRAGHDIRARHADSQLSTEELRMAMVHYRNLIEDLLEARPQTIRPRLTEPRETKETKPPVSTELPAARPAPESEKVDKTPPRIIEPAPDTSLRPDAETRVETNRA